MLGEDLRRRKEALSLTTKEWSDLSGVPVGTINKILSGETKSPQYDTLCALEAALERSGGVLTVRETASYQSEIFQKKQGEYTVDDYYALPEDIRVELLDGELIYMQAPLTLHQFFLTELLFEFQRYVRDNNGNCLVLAAPLDVQLDCNNKTMLQPDIVIVCDRDKVRREGVCGAPDLVVEIVSDGSRKLDYRRKLSKYADAGVREYWIVDPKRQAVVTYYFEEDEMPYKYGFQDRVPVRIYGRRLEVDFSGLKTRLDNMNIS